MNSQEVIAQRIERIKRDMQYRPQDNHTLSFENTLITRVPTDLPEGIRGLTLNGTDIREIDGATLPRSVKYIDATNTKIHSVRNLDHLPNLIHLNLAWSPRLDVLTGPMPRRLMMLDVRNCENLCVLPRLAHTNLHMLCVIGCWSLEKIPDLPHMFQTLLMQGSGVLEVPYLPDSVIYLHPTARHANPHPAVRTPQQHVSYYQAKQRKALLKLRKERFDLLHESLMAAAWHPSRVSKWSLAGEEVLDMMMGC